MKCSYCGKEMPDSAKFCKQCGAMLEKQVPIGSEMSDLTINIPTELSGSNVNKKHEKRPNNSAQNRTSGKKQKDRNSIMVLIAVFAIVAVIGLATKMINPDKNNNIQANGNQGGQNPVAAVISGSDADNEQKTSEATEEENYLVPMDYCGADYMNYPLSPDEFTEISSPDGVYTLKYPRDFFKTGYYNTKDKSYEFVASDGVTTMTITEQEAPIKNNPVDCANWLLEQYSQDFLVTGSTPYTYKSTQVAESGYSRSVIAGPLISNQDLGKYIVTASTNEKTYILTYMYESDEAEELGFNYTPKGYVVDCVYRGWSISGSTYQLRTYDQYLADDMGTKKP